MSINSKMFQNRTYLHHLLLRNSMQFSKLQRNTRRLALQKCTFPGSPPKKSYGQESSVLFKFTWKFSISGPPWCPLWSQLGNDSGWGLSDSSLDLALGQFPALWPRPLLVLLNVRLAAILPRWMRCSRGLRPLNRSLRFQMIPKFPRWGGCICSFIPLLTNVSETKGSHFFVKCTSWNIKWSKSQCHWSLGWWRSESYTCSESSANSENQEEAVGCHFGEPQHFCQCWCWRFQTQKASCSYVHEENPTGFMAWSCFGFVVELKLQSKVVLSIFIVQVSFCCTRPHWPESAEWWHPRKNVVTWMPLSSWRINGRVERMFGITWPNCSRESTSTRTAQVSNCICNRV